MSLLSGVGVSPGRASGPVVRVADAPPEPPAAPPPNDPASEAARIRPAADSVAGELSRRSSEASGDAQAVLETTAAMAMDPALISQAEQHVTERGLPAARAVHEAANGFADSLRAAGGYLAERVRDVHDVRDRIVAALLGVPPPGVPQLTGPAILLARDLAPADTADLDPQLVLALVTEEGGPTSHTAILARSFGIPAVVAVRGLLADSGLAGAEVDGATGTVQTSATPLPVQAATLPAAADWSGQGATADGYPVKILANIGSADDARNAAAERAEGVGLFRTEFCYLSATDEPSVRTQTSAYTEALAPLAGKPVVVRTLDAGADKPLPFIDLGDEANPALGVRGLRIAFDRPEILDRQLTAIVAAAQDSGAEVSVMAPMVATAGEAAWFAERAHAAGVRRVGVMIEVPAAALDATGILDAVDFVSLGTNDLAQYLFAADRMSGALASLNDPWQPAMLRLIGHVGEAGRALDKPVGVCGEAAADPLLAGVLVGLGITSLSAAPAALAATGATVAANPLQVHRAAVASGASRATRHRNR